MQAAEQRRALEGSPTGSATSSCTSRSPASTPGPARCAGFYGGQDYLETQINWAAPAASPGSTFKPFALAAGLKDGFSLKDTFDGNSPYTFPDGSEVQQRGRAAAGTDYGSAINLITATEESINTAFVDLTAVDARTGPQKIAATWPSRPGRRHARRLRHLDSPTSPAIPLGSAHGQPDQHGQRLRDHRQRRRARTTCTSIEKVDPRQRRQGALQARRTRRRRRSTRTSPPTRRYALQQVVQTAPGGSAQALGRPAAGKTGTATNDKDQVSSSWFVGYTPQLATAVMYVRGNGNEQLDGWLRYVPLLRRRLPGAHLDRDDAARHGRARRRGVPAAGVRRRQGADRGPRPGPDPPPQPTNTPQPTQDAEAVADPEADQPTADADADAVADPDARPRRPPRPRRRPCPRARRPTATATATAAAGGGGNGEPVPDQRPVTPGPAEVPSPTRTTRSRAP